MADEKFVKQAPTEPYAEKLTEITGVTWSATLANSYYPNVIYMACSFNH